MDTDFHLQAIIEQRNADARQLVRASDARPASTAPPRATGRIVRALRSAASSIGSRRATDAPPPAPTT